MKCVWDLGRDEKEMMFKISPTNSARNSICYQTLHGMNKHNSD
jgi:hypothetical protein